MKYLLGQDLLRKANGTWNELGSMNGVRTV